jgi:hypothetical protein
MDGVSRVAIGSSGRNTSRFFSHWCARRARSHSRRSARAGGNARSTGVLAATRRATGAGVFTRIAACARAQIGSSTRSLPA